MNQDRGNRNQKERMLAGLPYKPWLDGLPQERERARRLCHEYNHLPPERWGERTALLKRLLGKTGERLTIEPNFHCDYGTNITIGSGSFVNFNCVFLDGAPITIGKNVLIGPAVQIYTPIHPLDYKERRKPIERAEPVTIGDDCWICGGAVILPGVKIGNRCIIAAGSVVTQDVPDDCMAAGNPATVKKRL